MAKKSVTGEAISMFIKILCITETGYCVEYSNDNKIEKFFVPITEIEFDEDPNINPDLEIKKGFKYWVGISTWVLYDNAILN